MIQNIHLNPLLDAIMMILLDHYAYNFHKWLAMLNALKVTRQCLLRLATTNC